MRLKLIFTAKTLHEYDSVNNVYIYVYTYCLKQNFTEGDR